MVKIRVYVATNKVGSQSYTEFEDENWDDYTEDEKAEIINETGLELIEMWHEVIE